MSQWIRVDVARHTSADGRDLNGWGNLVIEIVWEIVKQHGYAGGISGRHVTPEAILEWMRMDREDAEEFEWLIPRIQKGLDRCFEYGAMIRDGGEVLIPHWDRYQKDQTASERMKRYRERKASLRDVTLRNATSRYDVTGNTTDETDETHTPRARVYTIGEIQQRIWQGYSRAHEARYAMLPPQGGSAWQTALDALAPVIQDVLTRDGVPDDRVDAAIDVFMARYFASKDDVVVRAKHALGLLPHRITDIVTEARKGGAR